MNYLPEIINDDYGLYHGDCCEVIRDLPDNSMGMAIFSPPFSNLYIYSDSVQDMGNATDDNEFFLHYGFLAPEIYRVTKPGRLCVMHCKDLPRYMGRDGSAGLKDFPGRLIIEMEKAGWTYHSRVTIWKDPVIEMQRTKNHGLLYKELCKDSCNSRQGMADYLVVFRKWSGEGKDQFSDPVTRNLSTPIVEESDSDESPVDVHVERFDSYVGLDTPDADYIADKYGLPRPARMKSGKCPNFNPFPIDSVAYREWSIMVWQRYASPVWMDIDQTNVLNYKSARSDKDEKHICPLQLDVVERAVHLWTNSGDTVFSPFAGIGSEGYGAIKHGRRFVGIELKSQYFLVASDNLDEAVSDRKSSTEGLFMSAV